jgi:hypothetical protein
LFFEFALVVFVGFPVGYATPWPIRLLRLSRYIGGYEEEIGLDHKERGREGRIEWI